MQETRVPPQQQLLGLATGFQLSQAVYVAAKLDIAQLLAEGPMSAEELASAAGARADMLYRLLRALASVGLFREVEAQVFEATPVGKMLASSAEGSLRDLVIFSIESHYAPFGALLNTVTTGENAMEHVFGYSFFDWLANHPDMAVRYSGAMADLTYAMKAGAASMHDFRDARTIVDLGGADGSLCLPTS